MFWNVRSVPYHHCVRLQPQNNAFKVIAKNSKSLRSSLAGGERKQMCVAGGDRHANAVVSEDPAREGSHTIYSLAQIYQVGIFSYY